MSHPARHPAWCLTSSRKAAAFALGRLLCVVWRAASRVALSRLAAVRVAVVPLAIALGAAGLAASGAGAQGEGGAAMPADSTKVRFMEGHIQRAANGGLAPVRGLRVILHRIGSDRAGPLDSTTTGAQGHFLFRFRATGAADAVYIASVTYGGIAYFSTPAPGGAAADADITVFDTTSGPIPIRIAGHHVVMSAPGDDGTREVEEIFELSNDSSLTRVAGGGSEPTWSTRAPAAARDLRAAPSPDIAPGAVQIAGRRIDLFAPLSPGIRQVAFAYRLPAAAFPLVMPIESPTAVLEVLVEEPGARVTGARIAAVASVTGQGRTFRRFLGQDVQSGAVLRIEAPPSGLDARSGIVRWIAGALVLVMVGAIAWGVRIRRGKEAATTESPTAEAVLRELARLDAGYARIESPSESERATYRRTRAELKARAARALAAERERR